MLACTLDIAGMFAVLYGVYRLARLEASLPTRARRPRYSITTFHLGRRPFPSVPQKKITLDDGQEVRTIGQFTVAVWGLPEDATDRKEIAAHFDSVLPPELGAHSVRLFPSWAEQDTRPRPGSRGRAAICGLPAAYSDASRAPPCRPCCEGVRREVVWGFSRGHCQAEQSQVRPQQSPSATYCCAAGRETLSVAHQLAMRFLTPLLPYARAV